MALAFPLTRGLVLPLTQALINPLDVDESLVEEELVVSVVASADDASETISTGAMDLTNIHVRMTSTQISGVRLRNVTIPQGAPIVSAFIQLTASVAEAASSGSAIITGEDADDSAIFTTDVGNITARPVTTASVVWTFGAPWVLNDRTAAQLTPDLKTIVQEIVDRAGWASGNDMTFFFDLTDTQGRFGASFDHTTLQEPTLTVRYLQ